MIRAGGRAPLEHRGAVWGGQGTLQRDGERNKGGVWPPGRGLWAGQGTLKRGDFKSTGVGGNYGLVYVLEWKVGAQSGGDQTRRSEQDTDC